MRVELIPTGKMELLGLADALVSLFPGHEFISIPRHPGRPDPFDGFTSSRVDPAPIPLAGNLTKLVQVMAGRLVPGYDGDSPDLIVVLDDLELANSGRAQVVVDAFGVAVTAHLDTLPEPLRGRTRAALRGKASFHLSVPMTESWFFAAPPSLQYAGVPAARSPNIDPDPELFHSVDKDYLADDCSDCLVWQRLLGARHRPTPSKRKSNKPEWCSKADRALHPKAYLSWLCKDVAEKRCSTYRESIAGVAALTGFDWALALAKPDEMTFLRAFVDDLAKGLEAELPCEDGDLAPATCLKPPNTSPFVLRNI